MPLIHLTTSAGPGAFHYTLSTPAEANAEAIVEGPQTLILLHPLMASSELFHPMYADARLRRFNLLTLDLRGYGSTSANVEETYGRETAARDVLNLMDALKISASHLMGVSIGSCIALQIAIFAPDRVLSVYDIDPQGNLKPLEIIEGRQEIWDCWVEAFSDPQNVDVVALTDSMTGGMQFASNGRETNLTRALLSKFVSAAIRNWGGVEHFDLFHAVTTGIYLNREPHSVEILARVRCPVALVHCSEDIVYQIHHTEELLDLMQRAGVDAELYTIDGAPHYGNVTHIEE
ncbi:Alpha/Beta hydrolase protein [Mycena capillaripes]|nr:Alpha/Beta hydrolase protein [Mycena capillaripes]